MISQDTRSLAQLPPPDPRFDSRMQAEQRGGGGADSHLRGGADGGYYPGQQQQQGLGGQVRPVLYVRATADPTPVGCG